MMGPHEPYIQQEEDGTTTYVKVEYNLVDMIFRKTWSVSLRKDMVDRVHRVRIEIPLIETIIEVSAEAVQKHNEVNTFYGETKYYYPIKKWKVISGKTDWYVVDSREVKE